MFAWVDDNTICVPLQDVNFFCTAFQRLAKRGGFEMNTLKTRILTSTDGYSIIPRLAAKDRRLASEVQRTLDAFSCVPAAGPVDRQGHRPTAGVELTDGPSGVGGLCGDIFLVTTSGGTSERAALERGARGPADTPTRL